MIDSGRNGILVSPGDPQKLAEALILLARDREWAKELGRAAADYARRHFSAERMVSQVEMVYRRLLEGKQAVPVLGKGEGE
jgi:mannosyltransferase